MADYINLFKPIICFFHLNETFQLFLFPKAEKRSPPKRAKQQSTKSSPSDSRDSSPGTNTRSHATGILPPATSSSTCFCHRSEYFGSMHHLLGRRPRIWKKTSPFNSRIISCSEGGQGRDRQEEIMIA